MNGPSARPTTEALLAHVEWVRRLARLLVANVHDADDVEQETWRQALERPPRTARSLRHWFAAVVRNVARKRVRGEEARERNERGAAASATAATYDVTARAELHRRVVDAVLSLEEINRIPLLLRFFDDLSAAEVAQRLGVPVETARTRIKRGLALLRARLGAEFGSDGVEGIAALLPLVTGGKGTAAVATAAAAGGGTAALAGGGLFGLVVGGAFMSKLAKVAVGVVVAGLAGLGTYKAWLEPRPDRDAVLKSATKPVELPPPEIATPPPATAPAAAAAATREAAERATPAEKPTPAAALATIDGVVLDASARPVAGAKVVLGRRRGRGMENLESFRRSARGFNEASAKGNGFDLATSGADGSFRFEEVDPNNQWTVGAIHDPLGIGWNDQVAFAGTPASARVVVTLEAGVVIFGVVKDPAGQPIAGANVILEGATKRPDDGERFNIFGQFNDSLGSAEDGTYRSVALPWHFVHMHVLAWGRPELAQLETKFEEVPQGVTEFRRDLTVEAMTTLRGRVVTADGQPARLLQSVVPRLGDDATRVQSHETIAVAAFAEDPRRRADAIQTLGRNDPGLVFLDADHVYGTIAVAEDRYEIPLRSAQLRFIALIARDQILGVAEIPTPPSAPDLVVDLALVPQQSLLHTLRLHVRSARDHAPLDAVHVHATAITRWPNGGLGGEILNFKGSDDGLADRDLELPRMPCSIFVVRDGYAGRNLCVDASRIGAPTEATVELQPVAGPLHVHVVDGGGAPLSGAWPRFYRAADHEEATLIGGNSTDEHGEATFTGFASGELLVVMEKPGYAAAAATATIDDEQSEVEVVLERGYDVTIHAQTAEGRNAGYGQLAITNEAGVPLYDHFRGDSGPIPLAGSKFRLTDGNYTVRCLIPGGDGATQKFVAAPGAVVDVALAPIH
jgi:RNA polymerase sigma factor (sigma-70 family)